MKIKITNVSELKKIITLSSNLSKRVGNGVEDNLFFKLKDGVLSVTTGVSGSHLATFSMPVDSTDEGDFAINCSLISSLIKIIPCDDVLLSVSKDSVNITVPSLGTKSIPLYNSTGLSHTLTCLAARVRKYQVQNSSTLGQVLKTLGSISSKDKPIRVQSCTDYIQLIGLGDLAHVACSDFSLFNDPFDLYLDPFYLPIINQLVDGSISLGVEKGVIELSSSIGNLYILNNDINTDEYESVKNILKIKTTDKSIHVNTKELISAIQWQSHGCTDLDVIELSLDKDNKLSILGKSDTASSLALLTTSNVFSKVRVNVRGLINCLNPLNDDVVSIEQRVINLGSSSITTTCFSNSNYKSNKFSVSTLLFEQV